MSDALSVLWDTHPLLLLVFLALFVWACTTLTQGVKREATAVVRNRRDPH